MREICWSFQYLHVQNGARGCGCLVVVSTSWLERYRDDVIQGWMQASAPQLCSLPRPLLYPAWRGADLSVPQGRAAQPLSLDMPFLWACVHLAVQGILTNHGEFSSKALVIFIRLGNDAFTHTVFGKGSLLSSCLGLSRAGRRAVAVHKLRQSRWLLLASPGVHAMRGRSRRLERARCFGAVPALFPAV